MKRLVLVVLLTGLAAVPYYAQAEDKAATPAVSAVKAGDKGANYEKLSPEAKAAMEHHKDMMEKLSPAVRGELKNFKEARRALYEKLSPDAKLALKEMRKERQTVSPEVRKEIRAFHQSKEEESPDQPE